MSWSSGKRITVVTTAIRVQFTVGMTIYNVWVPGKKVKPSFLTGASSSSGKGLTAVSTATWVRIPATGELTFRHRQGQRTDTWQHVTSLDHLCEARIPLYNSKKELSFVSKTKLKTKH